MNLREVKRDFPQLSYWPEVLCPPELLDEISKFLSTSSLREQFDETGSVNRPNQNASELVFIVQRVFASCSHGPDNNMTEIILELLAKLYTQPNVDDAVKRAVTKCFKMCRGELLLKLANVIEQHFINIMSKRSDPRVTEHFFKTLNECCEQFPDFVRICIRGIMRFFYRNLRKLCAVLIQESSPMQKVLAIRCIHESFRFFLLANRKMIFPSDMKFSKRLIKCCMELLDSGHLPLETLFNCCLSIVYLTKANKSVLECWRTCSEMLLPRSDLIKSGFCVAVLIAFTCEELMLIEPPDSGQSICSNVYDIIMESSGRNLNDSCILLSSSRALFVLSKRLCVGDGVCLKKDQLDGLITFLWLRMEHFLDGVRHLAKDTMINVIKINEESILHEVLERLSTCDKNSKAFVTTLTILSGKLDSRLIIAYLPRIAEDLLYLMSSNNSAVTIFVNLMSNHYSVVEKKLWFDYWLCPLFRSSDSLDVKHFEQIITKAVELTPVVSNYIDDLNTRNELSLKVYLICFNIEKKLHRASNNDDNEPWMNHAKFIIVKKAMHSNDENIRFIAVNLILDCHKKTQIFTDKELELMKYFITYNCKNEKVSIKQIHLSFVKKLLVRMNESKLCVAVKSDESLMSDVTKYYTEFQCWFSEFCFRNLFSDATFSRRNFCLESLRLIQTNLQPLGVVGLDKRENVSVIFHCLWDTYEQNKILAKDILTHKHQDSIKLENATLKNLLITAETLASSTSPPDSITAGYLFEVAISSHQNDIEDRAFDVVVNLMNKLNNEIKLADDNLTLASAKGPMYGLIHCIRHILNSCDLQTLSSKAQWIDEIEKLSSVCLKCIKLVSVVVNDSSPEGIVPMDDSCQNEYQITSQMVLLCAWRSTKESSLLLSDIVAVMATQKPGSSDDLITQICSCLTLLLSETKHRGAFEQIFVAYLKVCSVMWKSPTLHRIPHKYLEDVLTEIKTGLGETFCITRRSAGMPLIVQALICTNHDKRKIVDYTMETLISICENKNITENLEIGVVHALNVLRALFRCSQLGDLVGPFVSRAIDVSIILFNSSSWPIRNSSTLLLSALVNRVFGACRSSTELSWKNRMTGREFFQRYPELYDTFLNEFKKFSPTDMRPSLYPTLLILARLYPSPNEETDCSMFQLTAFIPYIFKCAQSPVMKTRMLAATSIAPQVTQNKLVDHLHVMYNELLEKNLKENTMHGLLIQAFGLVENLPKLMSEDQNKLVSLTRDILTKHDRFVNCSYVVQEVFLRCMMCLWLKLDDLQYDSVERLYASTLELATKLDRSDTVGRSKYLESATLFLFSVCLKAQTDVSTVLYSLIESKVHCRTTFEVFSLILSKKPVEYCDHLETFKNLKFWNRQMLVNQLTTNGGLVESVCQQCSVLDSLTDIKLLVLSSFTPALHLYFEMYTSIDDFISKLIHLRRDSEIAHSLLCINGYMLNLESVEPCVMLKLIQIFENIYFAQRSDDCKSACIDIIVDNYSSIVKKPLDAKIFLRLWTILIHYAEDNSEDVRNCVWRLMNTDANSSKSFELLFDKFEKHFDAYPSAVLTALICWSYLDVELPQNRQEGQVFDGGDTSEFKEHTVRRTHALDKIVRLTDSHPESIDLKVDESVQEWITEEWTCDVDVKPTIQNLNTVGDVVAYAKDFYTNIFVDSSKISLC